MVCASASVNLPLHHKVQKFSPCTGSPWWSRKRGRKMVVVVVMKLSHSVAAQGFVAPGAIKHSYYNLLPQLGLSPPYYPSCLWLMNTVSARVTWNIQ